MLQEGGRRSLSITKDGMEPLAIEESAASVTQLPFSRMLVYSSIKFTMSIYDFTLRPARFGTYIEGFGMPASVQAVLIAIVQGIALFVGVIIGKWSDGTRSSWGRRKPFLLVAMPIGTFCFLMFCAPSLTPWFNEVEVPDAICTDKLGNCDELAACIVDGFNVSDGQPMNPIVPESPLIPDNILFLSGWFVLFYGGYYTMIYGAVSIPYDALGMELTEDSERRLTMFAVRGFVQIVGYAVPSVALIFLNAEFADDVPLQYALMAMVYSVIGIAALLLIVSQIQERPQVEKKEEVSVPIVPSIRRVMANRPYLRYLRIRMPQQIVSLLPVNMQMYYIKFVMGREQYLTLNSSANILAIVGILVGMGPILKWARAVGRGKALFYVNGCMTVLFFIVFFIPGAWMDANGWFMYFLCFCVGLSWAAFYMIPDGMLSDCIDYDELHTGERSEAMYTVVETQLALFVEIIGGVLPLIMLEYLGYANNGGCQCGCGTSCASLGVQYARWICPGDVGFNCDGKMDTGLFFGDLTRPAPCSVQTDVVQWGIKFFYVGLTGICGALVMIPAFGWQLDPKTMQSIQKEIQKRAEDPEYVCTDPLTGKKVSLPRNDEAEFFAEHFSSWERRAAAGASDMVARLRSLVTTQLVTAIVVFVVSLVACAWVNDSSVWSVAIICLSGIFGLALWNIIRLGALRAPPDSMDASLMEPVASTTSS